MQLYTLFVGERAVKATFGETGQALALLEEANLGSEEPVGHLLQGIKSASTQSTPLPLQ